MSSTQAEPEHIAGDECAKQAPFIQALRWGASPALSFLWVHLNRMIVEHATST